MKRLPLLPAERALKVIAGRWKAVVLYHLFDGPKRLSELKRFGVKPSDEREYRLIQDWWTTDKSRVSPQELAFVFNAYDDCVAAIDEQIGRLFDELQRRQALDRTWVLLVSDHGESFGEHAGVFLHGSSLYQTELHVPLVVIPPPGIPVNPVVSETASLRNLARIGHRRGIAATAWLFHGRRPDS